MSGSDSSGWFKSRIEVALRGLLRRIQGGEDASQQLRRLTTLHEVGRTISSTLEMDAVLDLVMTKAVEILDAEAGSLLLVDRDGADVTSGDLVFRVVLGPAAEQLTGQRLPAGEGLAGKAFETGQGIIVNDVRADDEWYDVPDTATGFRTRSVLAVPLVSRGRSIGVLEVVNKKGNALFNDEDLDLLATFATQAAIALENASLYERTDEALSKRLQEIATVEEIDHELGATLDYDRIINLVLQRAIEVCDAHSGLIGFLTPDGDKLGSLYWHGDQPESVQELAAAGWPVDRGIVGRVVRSGEPTLVADVFADPDYEPVVTTTRSEIAVPITREERLIGVLNLESDRVAAFGHEDLRFLSHLAGHAGIAIENARLFQEERRRVQMLSAVGEITSEIRAGLDLDRTLNLILARVKDLFDYYIAEICLWDEEQQLMVTFASAGDPRYTARTGGIYHLSEGFTGWIARNQEWLLVPDISQRTDVQPKVVAEEAPVRSYVGLPLKTGEAFIGTLELASDETGAYSEESVEILQIMADQAAVAIQNARLFEAQQHQVRELEILFETSAAISSSLELNEVLRTVGRKIATALNVTSCSISDWDRNRDVVRTLIDEDLVPHASPDDVGKVYPLKDYPTTAKVLRERVPQVVQLSDPDCDPQERALMEQLGYRSLLMMPMVARDRVVGLLELFEARRVRDFSEDDIRLCRALANQAAVAFENARLYERTDERLQARVDELMALQRITQELNATLALDGILEVVLDSAIRITRSTHGNVMLMDLDTGEFTLRVAQGYSDAERSAIEDTLLHLDKDNITHQVLESREARIVQDALEETCTVCVRGDTRSALAVPIFYEGVVVGLINLRHIQPAAFDQEDLAAVQALAEQASIAIGNALRFEEQVEANTALRRRSEQMDSLLAVGEKLRADVPLGDTLEEIAYAIQETVGFNYVIISVVRGAPPMLYRLAAAGVPLTMLDEMKEIVQPVDRYERILRPEYQQGLCYFFPFQKRADWEAELDTRLTMPEVEGWQEGQWHPHDMLLAPLRGSGGRLLGYISVDEPRDGMRPSRQTLEVLAIFASQATIAVENANLYADAQRRADDLTLINEVGRTLTQVMEPKQVLDTVVKGVGLLLQCEQAAVFQQNRIDGRFSAVASYGVSLAEMAQFSFAPGEGLVGHVAATGESLLLPDISRDPRFVEGPVPIASMMLVPIKVGRHVIGVLTAGGPDKHALTESDRILLTTLADQAAVALESARLFSGTQQAAVRLSLLNEIGRRAAARLELREMLETTVEALHRNLGYYRVAVFLVDEDKQELYVAAANEDFWPVIPADYRLAAGQGLIGAAASFGETVLANDAFSDERFHQVEEWGAPASLSVPIRIGSQVTGVLHSEAEEKGAFTEEDAAALEIASDQLAVAIENARLFAAEARRRREAETLQAATQALSTTLDLQEILEVILSELQEVVPYDSASVQYLERDQLRIIGGRGFPNLDELLGARLNLTENDNPNREVVRTRKPQIVDDAPVLYRAFRDGPLAPAGIRSWMGIPLLFGDRLIGMLTLDKQEPGFYAEEHARLAMSFAVQAAVAIENARLFEAEARRRREAETLQAATKALSATLDLQEIFEEILRQLRQVVPYDSASVQQLEANELRIIGGDGFPNPDQVLGMRFDVLAEDNPNRIVVSTRKPYILDDAPVLYGGFAQGPHAQAAIRSWLGVPLLFGDQLIGMIALDKQEPGFYAEEHARLALAFAAQAAVAIQNARLFQQTQRRVAELATVNEIGRAISRALDAEQLVEVIYAHVSKLLDTRNFFVALYDDREEQIRVEFLIENGEQQAPVSFPMGQGLTSHLVGSGKPILISDGTDKYQRTHGLTPVGPPAKSWLGVPMIAEDQVLGGIVIQNYEREGEFDEGHLNLLSTIAGQAAIAYRNASLFQERERRIAELAVLNETAQAFSSTLELDALLELMYRQLSRLMDTTNFFIALYDKGRDEITFPFVVDPEQREDWRPRSSGKGLTGRIIKTKEPILLPTGVAGLYREAGKAVDVGAMCRSWLGVPMIAADEILGVIAVQSYEQEHVYDKGHLNLLSTVAGQAAIALQNASLFQERERRIAELAVLNEMSQAISAALKLEDLLETVYQQVSRIFDTTNFFIATCEEGCSEWTLAFAMEYGERQRPVQYPIGAGLTGYIIRTCKPVLLKSEEENIAFHGEQEIEHIGEKAKSWLGVPLIAAGQVFGVMAIQDYVEENLYGDQELSIFSTITAQVAVAMRNAQLYGQIVNFTGELEARVEARTRDLAQALAELTLERDRAETLYRITSELGATLDLDRVLQYALRLFADALGVEHGTITLLNQETGYLDLKAALGPGKVVEKRSERTSLTRGVGLAGWTLEHREPVLVPDVAEDPRWTEIHEYDPGVRSVVAAPLSLGGGDIVGVITLGHPDVAHFGEDHLQLVTAAASQIAIAVNNSDLYAYITEQADQLGSMLQTQRAEVAKNRAILESIADGVLVLDYNGRVLLVNPAAEELLGISAMVIEGEHYRHMLGLGETAAQRELAQQLYSELRTRLESAEDDPARLKAGGVRLGTGNRVLAVNIAPLLTAVGETPGLVAALRDISREAEVERLKNEFISTVSHELRTPMTSIKGYTDLLFLGMVGGLTDAQRNFLQIIKSNADRLTALVNDILDISRIETGRIRLTIESLDLAGIIDDVVLAFREQYRDKELDLEWDPPQGLPHVRGDAARITQILNNLVANAWQYTPSGGRVTVSVQPLDGMLQVDVADTGIGIDLDDMSRVFDRFYRVDDPVVEEAGGTGLGLSIVKMFVDMLGGEIWVESELGVGSTFSFTLPLATADLPEIIPELLTTEAPTVMGRRQKILVIEDDHDLALLLRRQLEAEGYQVLLTGSGEDALWLAKEEKPQLITLDIMLPDLDGFVVLERLKAHPLTAPIPVIIVSVLSETDRGYALGAVDYVVKPFEEDKLLHSVREALSPSEGGQVQTILVVDDDADIRGFLEEALSFQGYAVSVAANGEEALKRVQEEVPDLILLDIKMPGIDGYEVIRHLKSKEDTWAIPIIVLTASPVDKERDRVKVLGMGANQYLTKPLSIQTLIGEIKNAVAERQAE